MFHSREKTAPIYQENGGEALQSSWGVRAPPKERGQARKAPAFLLLFLGGFGCAVQPFSPQPLLCGGRVSWRPRSCTVPRCHRGSSLPRKLGFAPCPQPASPVEYHRLTCKVRDRPGTRLDAGERATLPRGVSCARQGPSREQHNGAGRGALFQTMISLTGWSGTKIAPRRSPAETVSSHLYIMAPSHSSFVWLPCLCLTRLPRLSGEPILPRAGYSTLSWMLSQILGNE